MYKYLSTIFHLLALSLPFALNAFVKETGIGLQGVAYPQSTASINYNPANVTEVGDRFDVALGVVYQSGRNRIKDSLIPGFNLSTSSTQAKYLPLGFAGISKQLNCLCSASLTLDGSRTGKGSQNKPFLLFGHGRQGTEIVTPILLPTVGCQFNSNHSFGISLPIIFARLKVNGFQNVALRSLYPDNVSNKGYDWAYGLGIRFGWLWKINPCWSFGFSYSPELLTASHFHKYKGLIPLKGKFEVPAQFRVGLAYHYCRGTIATEFEYNYSSHPRTLANSPFSTAPAGSKDGPSSGWRDYYGLKIGGDYWVNEALVLRAGIYFNRPVVYSKVTIGNFSLPPFIFRRIYNVGFTYNIGSCSELSFSYSHVPYTQIRGKNLLILGNGHLDMSYSAHTIWLGFGHQF